MRLANERSGTLDAVDAMLMFEVIEYASNREATDREFAGKLPLGRELVVRTKLYLDEVQQVPSHLI
jgi:hypothetical protein